MSENSPVPVYIDFLNRVDLEATGFSDAEILAAIESSLAAQGRGETEIEPRTHIRPRTGVEGHFNVLRGWIGEGIDSAGVKVVGDFVPNYKQGRPSEYGVLTLFDPHIGAPRAIIDATGITEMRTGAMTALGAKYLAPENPRGSGAYRRTGHGVLECPAAVRAVRFRRGSRPFTPARKPRGVRREAGSRSGQADRRHRGLAILPGRCGHPGRGLAPARAEPLLRTEWIRPGALVIPYGTMSAVELNLTDIMDKVVMDDWGQAHGMFGALRAHVDGGKLAAETLHAELGQIVAGLKPGRERADETILFWHRGLSLSDIALGHAMLTKAKAMGIGQRLRFY